MSEATFTISGFRGIIGETLTDSIAKNLAIAFGLYIKKRGGKKVLIARDGRESGKNFRDIIAETLAYSGIDVTDGDLLSTPATIFTTRTQGFDGAIIITASHNPREYNGLKFVNNEGLFLNQEDIDELKQYYEKNNPSISENPGLVTKAPEVGNLHLSKIREHIPLTDIKNKKFKVFIDCINGAGSIWGPRLLESLGCEVVAINTKGDGNFVHGAEPTRENLVDVGPKVKEAGAVIGFVQDPDADRLVVIDENGHILSEELTLALAVSYILSRTKGTVVVNMSTSRIIDDIALANKSNVVRTKVGEANVVEGIQKNTAIIGGEGNGGVIYPIINIGRDSFVGMALILSLLATTDKTVNTLVSELPNYQIKKDKVTFQGDLSLMYKKIKTTYTNAKINELDGLRIDFPENKSWVHIRPSNTEPIVRIIAEGTDDETVSELITTIKRFF